MSLLLGSLNIDLEDVEFICWVVGIATILRVRAVGEDDGALTIGRAVMQLDRFEPSDAVISSASSIRSRSPVTMSRMMSWEFMAG